MELRKLLIDTNIYVSYKRNNNSTISTFKHLDLIGLDVTVLAELYSGFKHGKKEKQNREELEKFINTPRVRLFNHDNITAEFYSEIYLQLRKKGNPIPTNDIWIAATAMQHGLALYTFDNHFSNIEGLIIISD